MTFCLRNAFLVFLLSLEWRISCGDLQYADNKESELSYPHPVYHTLEESERTGIIAAQAIYGSEVKSLITGVTDNGQIENKHSRHKRAITKLVEYYWKDAIIPYKFEDDVPDDEKHETLTAMKRHQRFTCVEFVPWERNVTRHVFNLPDESHVNLIKETGCWSALGNKHNDGGQQTSCCSRSSCVHELAHTLGVYHDHTSPGRNGWIRINWNNIRKDQWDIFIEQEPASTLAFHYDITSIMHYHTDGFKEGPWPSMTILFKDLEVLNELRGNAFYLWHEISLTNECQARKCPAFGITCINDGFVSYVDGACRCLCPPGLDHRTGCRTIYKNADAPPWWPTGSYAMISAQKGCPSNESPSREFLSIEYESEGVLYGQSDGFHLGGVYSDERVDIVMCSKDVDFDTFLTGSWQTGSYCILTLTEKCPSDFEATLIPVVGFNFTICCRDDGFVEDDIHLPIDKPFTLLPLLQDGPCQNVHGMLGNLEFLELMTQPTELELPSRLPVNVAKSGLVYVAVCYYEKYNKDCGDIIDLSREAPTKVITSPGYPSEYSAALECYWFVKAPSDMNILINFDEFDVGTEGKCDDDYVTVRYVLPGQHAPRRCGQNIKETIRTVKNTVSIQLHTNLVQHRKGFKATLTLVLPENHCFSQNDKGRSYRGKVNNTRDYQPCLPWDEVTSCPHHMFDPKDFDDMLEENYCRNPDHSFRPWCYTRTYEGQCDRNYCDVCRLEKVYDNSPDCEKLKKDGFCEKDVNLAMSLCAKTCNVPLPKSEESSSCGRPPLIKDGLITFDLRLSNVGDTHVTKCPYGPETVTRRCHSDGTWSPGNYVCGACPMDWLPFNRGCYRFFPHLYNQSLATDHCAMHDAILSTASTPEELNFITTLRPKLRRMWLGATREVNGKIWRNADGTTMDFHHWTTGAAAVRDGHREVCALINPEIRNNTFREESCLNVRPFVCKLFPSGRRVCVNRRWDCHAIMKRNPEVCKTFLEFARQQCPFSCGVCDPLTTPFCTIQPPSSNVVFISDVTFKYIPRGDFINYACRPGSVLLSGDLSRVCKGSGWFSGVQPVCIDDTIHPTPNNDMALVNRAFVVSERATFIINNTQFRIHRDGEITQWKFYSRSSGTTTLQIWRPRPDIGPTEYEFIGQNHMQAQYGMVNTVDIAREERIPVLAGDVIGVWSGRQSSQITWNTCDSSSSGNSRRLLSILSASSYFHSGDIYETKENECLTLSVTALVNVTSSLFARTHMMQIKEYENIISGTNRSYTGNNGYFRIKGDGTLVQWQLYSKNIGQLGLQVWREVPEDGENTFQLINQMNIVTGNNTKHLIDVDESEQINVKKNDVIGIWFGDPPGGITYHSCSRRTNPQAFPLLFIGVDKEMLSGEKFKFNPLSSCRVFSLLAVIKENEPN